MDGTVGMGQCSGVGIVLFAPKNPAVLLVRPCATLPLPVVLPRAALSWPLTIAPIFGFAPHFAARLRSSPLVGDEVPAANDATFDERDISMQMVGKGSGG